MNTINDSIDNSVDDSYSCEYARESVITNEVFSLKELDIYSIRLMGFISSNQVNAIKGKISSKQSLDIKLSSLASVCRMNEKSVKLILEKLLKNDFIQMTVINENEEKLRIRKHPSIFDFNWSIRLHKIFDFLGLNPIQYNIIARLIYGSITEEAYCPNPFLLSYGTFTLQELGEQFDQLKHDNLLRFDVEANEFIQNQKIESYMALESLEKQGIVRVLPIPPEEKENLLYVHPCYAIASDEILKEIAQQFITSQNDPYFHTLDIESICRKKNLLISPQLIFSQCQEKKKKTDMETDWLNASISDFEMFLNYLIYSKFISISDVVTYLNINEARNKTVEDLLVACEYQYTNDDISVQWDVFLCGIKTIIDISRKLRKNWYEEQSQQYKNNDDTRDCVNKPITNLNVVATAFKKSQDLIENLKQGTSGKGVVYLVKGVKTGKYKIGRTSRDILIRMGELETQMKERVILLDYTHCNDSVAVEGFYHACLGEFRIWGEFYKLPSEIDKYGFDISSLALPEDDKS